MRGSFRESRAMGLLYPFGLWRPSQEWNIWMLAFLPTRTVHSVERLAHSFVSSGLFICAGGIYTELIEWFFEYHGALLPRVGRGRGILPIPPRTAFAKDRSRCCLDLGSHI
jgi:hypothetical protein